MKGRLLSAGDRLARLLPARSRLPFRADLRELLGGIEREFESIDRVTGGHGRLAVDAGANEGWYSLRLARRFARVLAFEPNAILLRDLRAVGNPRIEIHALALSDRNGVADHFVPVRRGVALSGWGSLERDHLPSHEAEIRTPVPLRTLDSYDLEELDFIKIDVEGHELRVLEGAHATLRRCRPTVLIEVDTGRMDAIARLLADCGLAPVDAAKEDLPISPQNHLFRPSGSDRK